MGSVDIDVQVLEKGKVIFFSGFGVSKTVNGDEGSVALAFKGR